MECLGLWGLRIFRQSALVLALCVLGFATTAQSATALELLGGRFQVSADWRTSTGASGAGEGIAFSAETGLFWFFTPAKIELVVKVIDACVPPFHRIWFFASGLTDTEVTITVVDTWSGQAKTYHHEGGALFAPLADTGAFDTCGFSPPPPCGQGIRSDIEASPRPDVSAENLALLIGNGVAAEQWLYERLSVDLAAIRAAEPAVANAAFDNVWWSTQQLFVTLTPESHAAVQAGTYDGWDCLNTWFRGEVEQIYIPYVMLHFTGLLHPYRIGPHYLALPGVTDVEPHVYPWTSAGGPPPRPGLCAIADGAAFDYFIEGNVWRYFRVASAGAAPVAVGTWNGAEPAPSWRTRLEACYARLDESASGRQ